MTDQFGYFDEAYFERGNEKGTAYNSYKDNALSTPIFLEIAEAVKSIFEPKRVLEIGCATGPIVSHLNNMGIETHGIDVSEWAIANRHHENVTLQSAHDLDFPDGHFDLVISAHALEHIPVSLKDAAFAEISRVSQGAHHFHMLPILGEGPYVGDEAFHIAELKKDPTHVLLHNKKWWAGEWASLGWNTVPMNIIFSHDNAQFECSTSQIVLSNAGNDKEITERAFAWNLVVSKKMFQVRNRPSSRFVGQIPANPDILSYGQPEEWKDISFSLEGRHDFSNTLIFGSIEILGDKPVVLRFAAVCSNKTGTETTGVVDMWQTLQPGLNIVEFYAGDMNPSSGTPDISYVTNLLLGGPSSDVEIKTQLALNQGGSVKPLKMNP